jgi:hypothetical protein
VAVAGRRGAGPSPSWACNLGELLFNGARSIIHVTSTGDVQKLFVKLVERLGITRLSKSQVSVMAKDLDAQVEAFRTRPLDAGPYTFVAADALTMNVREAGHSRLNNSSLAMNVYCQTDSRPPGANGSHGCGEPARLLPSEFFGKQVRRRSCCRIADSCGFMVLGSCTSPSGSDPARPAA